MNAFRTLLLALLAAVGFSMLAAPVAAQDGGSSAPAAQEPQAGQAEGGHGHGKPTMEMSNGEFFTEQFGHSVPHVIWSPDGGDHSAAPGLFDFYNVNLFQWIAFGVLQVLFLPVPGSFGKKNPSWLARVLRGWCLWIRDEMVYSVMGKEEGKAWAPYFIFVFFFIAAMNVIGLVPTITTTATATPFVTVALALTTLLLMLGMGIKKNGFFGYFKGLLPHGLPLPLIPIMFVIEVVSVVVKPFALTIRLFANMLAGHLVIASSIGLVFLFAKMMEGSVFSYLTAIPAVGMAVFVFIIEAFVTLLQAYIFTLLSINFVYASMHQDH